jgi:hypothetical protein
MRLTPHRDRTFTLLFLQKKYRKVDLALAALQEARIYLDSRGDWKAGKVSGVELAD